MIYAAGTGAKEFDREESLRTLREIPMDLVQWSVTNSHRLDVPGRPARRPLQAPPGADRPAVRRAADVEVERQSLQPRRRQRRPQRGRWRVFPAAVLDGAVSRAVRRLRLSGLGAGGLAGSRAGGNQRQLATWIARLPLNQRLAEPAAPAPARAVSPMTQSPTPCPTRHPRRRHPQALRHDRRRRRRLVRGAGRGRSSG